MKHGEVGRAKPLVEALLHRGELGIIAHDVLQWEEGKSRDTRCQRSIMGGIART